MLSYHLFLVKELSIRLFSITNINGKIIIWTFYQKAEYDLKKFHRDLIEEIPKQYTRLAEYFCENKNTFNLDEFLAAFRRLCEKINSCK